MTQTPKMKAILAELQRDADSYLQTKAEFDAIKFQFQLARERLTTTRRLASEVMGGTDWRDWRDAHPAVRYAGLPVGEAILNVLEDAAHKAAFRHVNGEVKRFQPYYMLEAIVHQLGEGGYEFRSASPYREINMALTRLSGIEKNNDMYAIKDADRILEYYQRKHSDAVTAAEPFRQLFERERRGGIRQDKPADQS